MKVFVIADLRLFNNEQRERLGYANFKVMNEAIIKSWNRAVSEDDKVIIMGDLGNGTVSQLNEIFSNLNGDICYTSNDGIDKFTKEEWEQIGIRFTWKVSLFKNLDDGGIILYCIIPIKHMEIYEQQYKLIITDHTNPFDGMTQGIMMSGDAAKWGYSPIDTDNLIEIYNNMKEFEMMKNEEHRSDIKEEGDR